MNNITELFYSEFNVDKEYLSQLQPVGHLNSSYLQVLHDTAEFKILYKGETFDAQPVNDYIVYLIDGDINKAGSSTIEHINNASVEPLFAVNELAEVTAKQKSVFLFLDRTLCNVFEREYRLRKKLNMPRL